MIVSEHQVIELLCVLKTTGRGRKGLTSFVWCLDLSMLIVRPCTVVIFWPFRKSWVCISWDQLSDKSLKMKLFCATLVLWLIAILRRVSGEAGKSSHQTTERCFNSRINLLITFSKQLNTTSSATPYDSKPLKLPSQTKLKKKNVMHFFVIVLPRGVTTINCYLASVNPGLCATLAKRIK